MNWKMVKVCKDVVFKENKSPMKAARRMHSEFVRSEHAPGWVSPRRFPKRHGPLFFEFIREDGQWVVVTPTHVVAPAVAVEIDRRTPEGMADAISAAMMTMPRQRARPGPPAVRRWFGKSFVYGP